jgi:hypothetical protein
VYLIVEIIKTQFFDEQAAKELSRDWTLMRSGTHGVPTTSEWLNDILPPGARIGIDPVSSVLPLFAIFGSSYLSLLVKGTCSFCLSINSNEQNQHFTLVHKKT